MAATNGQYNRELHRPDAMQPSFLDLVTCLLTKEEVRAKLKNFSPYPAAAAGHFDAKCSRNECSCQISPSHSLCKLQRPTNKRMERKPLNVTVHSRNRRAICHPGTSFAATEAQWRFCRRSLATYFSSVSNTEFRFASV